MSRQTPAKFVSSSKASGPRIAAIRQEPASGPGAVPPSDLELFELMKSRLYMQVVGDILDRLGLTHQFLPQPIQPLRPEMKRAGRAMPALMIDVHSPQKRPFGRLTEALEKASGGKSGAQGNRKRPVEHRCL
jgi:hypothetical protein